MQQKIVYNDRPASINNKNDTIKAIYQNGLKKAALEQNAFIMNGDLAVEILWKQHLPADIDNILKHTLDALKGICYVDDCAIISLKISKRYSQKEQLIITIKNKFILSKFIKKLIYTAFIKPLIKFIDANFKDIIEYEKHNHNPTTTINPNNNLALNLHVNTPNQQVNPSQNLSSSTNQTTNQIQKTKSEIQTPATSNETAQSASTDTNPQMQAVTLIKTTLQEFKDKITIAYKFSPKNITIYIVVSKSLDKQERKKITHLSKEKIMALQNRLNQGQFTIHYGTIPPKSNNIKL